MYSEYWQYFGLIASIIGLACGMFFFVYSVRYYLVSILVLMKDQQELDNTAKDIKQDTLGFTVTKIDMIKHMREKNRKLLRDSKLLGFKNSRVKNELLIKEINVIEAGFVSKKVKMKGMEAYNRLVDTLRSVYWQVKREDERIVVYPATIGLRKRLHAALILIMKKAEWEAISESIVRFALKFLAKLTGKESWTIDKLGLGISGQNLLSYLKLNSKDLGFVKSEVGLSKKGKKLLAEGKKYINLENVGLVDDPINQPFVSVHLAFYNEENVADRCVQACLNQDYNQYEIIIADDSNDNTPQILAKYAKNKRIKIIRRDNREGYKGGALKAAIAKTNPKAQYIIVFDADFVPAPGTIKAFVKEFFKQNGNTLSLDKDKRLAAVQGYQWHVLNKDENFVTTGIRFGFSGGYMIERTAQQYLGAMKMIAGSVFIIRRDVLNKYTWQMEDGYTSIVEDWNLTIRMYIDGWKIGYTSDIKVPSECVNSLDRLSKQQVRWAEGHTWNVKKYFWKVMTTAKMTAIEKLEFLYYGPFYMQAALFMLGTFGWVVGELIFHAKVPGWTATLGWALVFTNLMALPVMCISGLVLEKGEDRDYNFVPFLTYIYYIIPSLAYASIRGLVSPFESGWVRTKKTGAVTDAVMESKMAGSRSDLIDKDIKLLDTDMSRTANELQGKQPLFAYKPTTTEELKDGRLWVQLKRVPRLGLIIIFLLGAILGGLTYISTRETISASAALATGYLNANNYISYYAAHSPASISLGRNNPSYTWYSDLCPTGNTAGGIAAGSYTSTIVLTNKPKINKVYNFAVGHVNASGGDYQYIASTNYTINQNTPSTLSINLGSASAIVCNPNNKRKLVYTISYVSSDSQCGDFQKCNWMPCGNTVADNNQESASAQSLIAAEKSDILPKLEIIPKAHAMVEVPICTPGDTCINFDDTYYYIPLKQSTSGTYPTKGISADSITLTKSAPTSSGYLDFEYVLNNLPNNFKEMTLTMDFTDLDLHGDTVSYGSTQATLFETFTLKDANDNIIAYLDSSNTNDDDFTWSVAIPDNLITNNSITLKARVTSATTLKQGTSISLTNTQEAVKNISLCGTVECIVPEIINMTAVNDCSSIKINWDQYTEQTIDGYKLLRSTTDPDLTYPEDGYYQYLTGQSTVSYTDTGITEGTGYYYRIGAYKNGVIVAYSNTIHLIAQSVCPTKKVSPILECVKLNTNNTYTAYFGYNNENSMNVNIPVGTKNKFSPNPINRGQTTNFFPGRVVNAFNIIFNGKIQSWYLKSPNGQSATVTASSSSTRCPDCSCCVDDLTIEYNDGITSITTPSIEVPEYSLLLLIPAYLWTGYKKYKYLLSNKI